MNAKSFTLSDLVAPLSVAEFLEKYWEKLPYKTETSRKGAFQDLLSFKSVESIIDSTDLRYPELRLVKEGKSIPLEAYARDVRWGNESITGSIDVDAVLGFHRAGATIILQALHRSYPPLTSICRSLEQQLGAPVQTNIYFTPKGAQGFNPHYDTHDVFVIQVSGQKRWKVYGSPFRLPLNTQKHKPEHIKAAELIDDFMLTEGEVLYLPRGYVHEALTTDEHSIHITLGVMSYRWLDVVEAAIGSLGADERFREGLPIGFADDTYAPDETMLAQLRGAIFEAIDLRKGLDQVREKFIQSRKPILFGALTQQYNADSISQDSIIVPRKLVIWSIAKTDTKVTIRFHGKEVVLPGYALQAVESLLQNVSTPLSELESGLDISGCVLLARRLVDEGLLEMQ